MLFTSLIGILFDLVFMRFRQLVVFACLVFTSCTVSNGDAERMCCDVAVGGRHIDLTTIATCYFFRCASCWHRHLLNKFRIHILHIYMELMSLCIIKVHLTHPCMSSLSPILLNLQDYCCVGCDAVYSGRSEPMIQRILLPPS